MEEIHVQAKYVGKDGKCGYKRLVSYTLCVVQSSISWRALTGTSVEIWQTTSTRYFFDSDEIKIGAVSYKTLKDFFEDWTDIIARPETVDIGFGGRL